jgi:hypothetical protein
MSSSVYIPASSGGGSFTPPASISVKTASYTIPAGRYARVLVNLEGSATFTINAVLALRGTQNSVITSNSNVYVSTGVPALLVPIPPGQLHVSSGNWSTSNSASTTAPLYANATDQKTVVQDFWCPTGTVISGTLTWRAVVEEYTI